MGGKLHLQLEPLRSGPKAYYGQYSYGPLGRTIHIAGGSNVFGHEWIHAFDHDLIERMQLDPQRTNLLSRFTRDKGLDPKDGTKAAFAKLLNTMFYDEGDLAHQRMQLQQLAGEVRKDGSPTEMARMAQENLKVIESGKAMKMQIKSSEYRKMAKEFSPNNPYWSDEEELLARAGESYLARGMEQNGVNPRGVVMPDEAYARGLDKRLKMTFPKNDELMAIHAAFKDVFDAARAEGIWGSAAAAKSNDYGMVDPNGFMRTARLAGDTPTLRKKAIEFMQVGNNLKRVQKSMKETTPFDRSRPIAERKWSKRASLWAGHVFNSKLAAMDAIIKANPESARPYLQQIRDAFGSQHGSGRATGEGMEQESRAQATTWQNGLAAILQKHGLLEKMTDLQDRMIVWGLTTGEDNYRGTPMPDNVKSVIQEARLLHNQVFDTAERAKLDIEYVGQQYPRIYDTSKINANQSNKDAFTADATKVYKVDFNNQVGVPGDKPDVLLKKYRQLSPGDKSDIDTKNPGVNAGMKELGKNLRRQRAIEKQLAAGPDPALSAELAQLQAEARQLAEDHHDAIGDHISSEAAIDWQLRTSKGYPGDFEKIGPSGRFLQHRTLPPETDRLMENWMVRDVRTVLPQYYEQVARKVAYAKRLGPKGEILESLLDNAARHGLMLNDGPTMRGLVQQITGYGEDGNATHNVIGPLANSVNAYGAALLMPRSMWTSLHEFAVSGLATGDLRVSLRSLANIMGDIIGTGAAHDRREVADLVGVTQSKLAESLMTARIGSDYHDSPRIAWLMQKYYKMIGLTGLTNAIRRANFGALNWHLRNQSRNLLSAEQGAYWDLRRDRARRLFNEMGIPPAEHLAFAAEMLTHDGVPEFNYLTDPNNAGFARLYGRAMRQLSDWSSQNPYKGDRPALAETPMGRFVWQLQHFNYAFQRNVLDPMVHNMGTDFAFMRDRALAQGAGYLSSRLHGIGGLANAGVGFAGAAGLLVASSLVTTMLREMLFNGDKLDEHKKKGDLGDWFTDLAIQRAGLSGSLDPLVQMVNNMRYNADANSLIAGASPTFIAKNLTDVIRGVQSAFDPEAPETNTRAHDATKALYNLVGIPAMAMMSMGIAGAGVPLVTPGASFAFQKLSSQQSAEHAADVTGPKGAKLPKGGEEDMNMTPDLSSTADEGMNMTPDLLAEPKPGEKTGGTVGASVPWGFLDDFIAPAAPLVKSGLGIVPGWMKAGAVGAAGLAGASSFMSRMEPYRNAPAPETPRSR
jgi:hypothetical protein